MSKKVRNFVLGGVVAAALALPMQAHAGTGPLSPVKYHKSSGVFDQEHPTSGFKLFVLYFDELDTEGRETRIQGSVGAIPFVGVTALWSRDIATATNVYRFEAKLDGIADAPVPMSGFMTVTYSKEGKIKTIAADGVINGESFSVPPMTVVG